MRAGAKRLLDHAVAVVRSSGFDSQSASQSGSLAYTGSSLWGKVFGYEYISEWVAGNTAGSGRGPWYLARSRALSTGLSNAYFRSLGLPSLFGAC
jgi:hypothetical protein